MQIHRYRIGAELRLPPSAVTIGNFDGIHLGHQQVIAETLAAAKQANLASVVVFLEPQPLEFFKPDQAPARLTKTREKLVMLQSLGVEHAVLVSFNQKFANLTAEQFVKEFLLGQLNAKHIVVGEDFRFGKQRSGDLRLLRQLLQANNSLLTICGDLILQDERVSSSRVRHALQTNDLIMAEHLLGRRYSLSGRVCHGDKRGRELGFPTANIFLHRSKSPVLGIYVVQMRGVDSQPINGVANIGSRPTVGGGRVILEVYLFNFNRDIYGYHVEVDVLHKLRDEEYYPNLELLKQQIEKDVEAAEAYFSNKV